MKLDAIFKWASEMEDAEIFNVGISKRYGYHINMRFKDKRFVEAFGETPDDVMKEFSRIYKRVMAVRDTFAK